MLIIKRLLNWCEIVGYAKASAELSRQGFHAEAKALMLEKTKLQGRKERALVRLEAKKKFKAGYDPGQSLHERQVRCNLEWQERYGGIRCGHILTKKTIIYQVGKNN